MSYNASFFKEDEQQQSLSAVQSSELLRGSMRELCSLIGDALHEVQDSVSVKFSDNSSLGSAG